MQVPSHVELKFTFMLHAGSFCVLKKFWVLLLKVLTMSSVPGGPACGRIFEKVPHLELEVLWLVLFGSVSETGTRSPLKRQEHSAGLSSGLWPISLFTRVKRHM